MALALAGAFLLLIERERMVRSEVALALIRR